MPPAKKAAPAKAVSTVSTDDGPGISPELEDARDAARKAEVDAGVKDAKGALLVDTEPEIGLDPELAKAREAALKAEKDRRTY